jgi:NAD(P)-dependent dehydrogenase (short-subunit alcohol dehydrogenase family)
MSQLLRDRVAVLVGVGLSGDALSNGRATALEFARQGARLVLADKDEGALMDCLHAVEKIGGEARPFLLDATQEQEVEALFAFCSDTFGEVGILHNNLGITSFGRLSGTAVESFETSVSVNLKSIFLLCKHAVRLMEPKGTGAITNISSISSIRHLGINSPLYDMTKAGVNALTRHIAVDLGPKGIRANAILVGMIDTPLARGGIAKAGRNRDEIYETYANRIPLRCMGRAIDIAHLAAFLASDHAAYINGAEIVIDGGLTIRSG